jgi:hypothetical protein
MANDPARGRPRGSVQRGPDGKLNTSGLTIDDITPEIAREAFADPEFRARAVPGAAVGVDHGYNI